MTTPIRALTTAVGIATISGVRFITGATILSMSHRIRCITFSRIRVC